MHADILNPDILTGFKKDSRVRLQLRVLDPELANPEILYTDVLNPEIHTGVKDSCVRLQSRGHRTPPEIADCTKTCVFRIF